MSDEPRTPIDAAIDSVEASEALEELRHLEPRVEYGMPVLATAHELDGTHEVVINAMPGEMPTLLMWDGEQGAWRPILLPDDSKWRLVPDRAGLWTPGGST